MKTNTTAGMILAGTLMAWATTAAAETEVDVKLVKISEQRIRQLVKSASPSGTSWLTVTLTLQGKLVETVTHFGKTRVSQAKDDRGNSLTQKRFSQGFQELDREHMWFFEDEPPKNKIKIDLLLAVPPRNATKLAVLEGSVQLKSSKTKDVFVSNPASLKGKSLKNPTLEKAGIEVVIKKVESQSVELKVTDPKKALVSVHIVDATGEELENSTGSFGFNNVKTMNIDSFEALPSDARLKLVVATDTTFVTVPFSFSDIELP